MKKLTSKIAASALAFAMLFGTLTACGKPSAPADSDGGGAQQPAAEDGQEAPKVEKKNQIVIGTSTDPSGDFSTPLWQNNATDNEINNYAIQGYETFSLTKDGEYVQNKTSVESFDTKMNDDGTKTYTFKLKQGLTYSDGTPITAKDYVAGIMLFASKPLAELGCKTPISTGSRLVGFKEFSADESKVFKGVRLLGDYEFSATILAEYVPSFFEYTMVAYAPLSLKFWVGDKGGEIDIKDDGEGCYFTDNFTSENVKEAVEKARFEANRPSSGPYVVESFDKANGIITLKINPKFEGMWDGQKPSIETIVYKKINDKTQVDELKTGSVDLLYQVMEGEKINACLDMTEDENSAVKFDYVHYPRSGFGKLQFVCDYGPTQFVEVRQAIAYLLNRDSFVQQFTKGFGSVVNGPYGEGQWFYKAAEKELKSKLNPYAYSLDDAKRVLDEGGWNLNEKGEPYVDGQGLRYKQVGDELMPLVINWASSDGNPVSDLITTLLKENPDVKSAGMEVKQDTMQFPELLSWLYRDGSQGEKYAQPHYNMFNLASSFPVGNVPEYDYTVDEEKIQAGLNTNFIRDEELAKISNSFWKVDPSEKDKYVEGFTKYIETWNKALPDLPLYSNDIHDFFNAKLKDYDNNTNIYPTIALVYAKVEYDD